MADNTITIKHEVGSSGNGGGGGNIDLTHVLQQQNSLLQTLNNVLGKLEQTFSVQQKGSIITNNGGGSNNHPPNTNDVNNNAPNNKFTNSQNVDIDASKYLIKGALSGLMVGVSQYASKYIQAETGYIMAQAQTRGSFAQSAIMGNAFEEYPQYLKQQVENEKNKTLKQTSAKYEAPSTAVGTAIGTALGYTLGAKFGLGKKLALAGGSAGAYVGDIVGKYFASEKLSAISQKYDVKSAEEQKNAMLRNAFWQSPLASYGGGLDEKGKPISASDRFMKSYGNSQMALPIAQGILPFMNQDYKGMDLEKVSKNFLQAGFSVDQFSKLTLQATQYQVVTGKNLQAFSQDMMQMRAKYRGAYDLNTNQTAIDLMTKGVKPEEAQKIAYQSQFNPSVLQNVNSFLGNDRVSFEQKKALGESLGFNWLETERTGNLVANPEFKKKIKEEYNKFNKSGKKEYGTDMTILGSFGVKPELLGQWLSGSPEGVQSALPKESTESTPNEAMTSADNVLQAIQAGLSNLNTLNVQSATVNVYGNVNNKGGGGSGGSPIASTPFPF